MSEKKSSQPFDMLWLSTKESLHYIIVSGHIENREQAIEIKNVLARNLGVLNSKFNLQSNSPHNFKKRENRNDD